MTLDDYFKGYPKAKRLFAAVRKETATLEDTAIKVSKSQIAFRRKRGFAWVWVPAKYLGGETAPLVLSVALPRRDRSKRWKEVVEPAPGRFMHHLEVREAADIDGDVRAWLRAAWDHAG